MSLDDDSLKNAAEFIERFGGIRPMAAKIGAPVTTVQGWKKRDVIPGARRDDIIKAASENGIEIGDLLDGGSYGVTIAQEAVSHAPSASAFADIQKEAKAAAADEPKITIEPILKPQVKPLPSSFQNKIDTSHEDLMRAIEQGQKKAVNASLWSSAIFVVLVGAGATFLLWPTAQKIDQHDMQLAEMEGKMSSIDTDVQSMNETANFLKGMVPDEVKQRMGELRAQADDIQKKVTDVAIQAESIRDGVLATDAGSLADRLSILEAKLRETEGGQGLADVTARVRGLESAYAGGDLSASVNELRKIVDSLDGQVNTIDAELAQVQQQQTSPLGQTLQGVTGNDLKAAAMLIAFAQLRELLNRSAPFQEDLVLLQKLAGEDDPELQTALTKLAPQAQQGGVLTKEGLSDEFKTMAGDIVFSSLKGEDVSITEKAKVRLTEIVNVKKDGEVIGGNETQQAVSTAQTQLDQGDVQGAIATLQSLDGDAKQTAQPFIDQAQATLMAEQVQNLLRQTILAKVGADVTSAAGTIEPAQPLTADDIKAKVQSVLPGQQNVVEDEESGFKILPAPKGFKGFSDTQAE